MGGSDSKEEEKEGKHLAEGVMNMTKNKNKRNHSPAANYLEGPMGSGQKQGS
jgi:hypothetical protein